MRTKRILINLILGFIVATSGYLFHDSIFDRSAKYKLNIQSQEISDYYNTMLSIQERLDEQVPNGSTIMIGDSITQGLFYPRFINFGIGSDTTYGVLNRLPKYHSIDESSKIILMIGVNDLKRRSNDEIIANYQRILDNLPSEKLVVFSILPVSQEIEFKNSRINNDRIRALNEEIKTLCNVRSIKFLDINSLFTDDKGYIDKIYHVGDGIHLNNAGYNVWINYLDKL